LIVDCEKFDRIVLDLLYDELDELTTAAARRHTEHCSRCRGIASGLRATRHVGALPLVEAPSGLSERIFEAERRARASLPVRARFGRGISVLAGYAMRPQLAMAALLLLMIGSSLLFLRVRPGARESVRVTERGVPETESEAVALVPAPEQARAGESKAPAAAAPVERELRRDKAEADEPGFAAAPPAVEDSKQATADEVASDAGTGDETFDRAMSDYRAGRYDEAQKGFAEVVAKGGQNAASASLFAAQALRRVSGCGAAAPRFESVGAQNRGTGIGNEATWQAADCYRALGHSDDARRNYDQLVGIAGYDDRAQRALASLDEDRVAARKAAPAKAAAKPATKAGAKAPQAAPAPKATDDSAQKSNSAY
jgi:hypothetical protein